MKYLMTAFWSAFVGLSLFNAYMHVANHAYAWLLLDALCLFIFTRNIHRSLRTSRSE